MGARTDEREIDRRRSLLRFELLTFDAAVDFDAAVRIYRRCRHEGVTPRELIDCMIVSVAQRYEAALLASDRDLGRVAAVVGLELDRGIRQVVNGQ